MSDLLSMTALAKSLGVAKSTIHIWTEAGVIIPEIHEGKVIRLDPEKVRQRLAERVQAKTKENQ